MKLVEIMFTIFTNMPNLDNSTNTMRRLLKVFEEQDVMFNSIQLLNVVNNSSNVINRPQVVNQKEKWRFEFLPERINFTLEFDKDTEFPANTIKEKSELAKAIIEKLYKEFQFKGSRFALNTNYVVENVNLIDVNKFIAVNSIDSSKQLYEWNTRKSYRESVNLNEVPEVLNVVEEINRINNNQVVVSGKPMKLNGLMVHFDINTSQFSKGERLKNDEFADFLEKACNFESEKVKCFKEGLE